MAGGQTVPMRVRGPVLWDVDETLVDVSGVSRDIYAVAFEKVTVRPLLHLADMHRPDGAGHPRETLGLNGVDDAEFGRFYEALILAAHELRERMREIGRALPGAHTAIVQSVATGNIRPIAETKLEAFAGDLNSMSTGTGRTMACERSSSASPVRPPVTNTEPTGSS
jgi:phosphoglycolate phosphatase-like HAD superfamily hydrolase